MKHTQSVFIGLGSNLGDSVAQLRSALALIGALPTTTLVQSSSFYHSAPMGPPDQPIYTNAVCNITTALSPIALLDALQQIEQQHGRVRTGEHWGPRTLDLDILLFDDVVIHSERLTIPHYGMRGREFVLVPLFEIAPALSMPDHKPLSHWVKECDLSQLHRLHH